MTDTLKLEVGIPPSTNNAYATVRGVGRILSLEGRGFKMGAKSAAMAEAYVQKFRYPERGRLSLTLRLYFPNNRRRDISNCVKLIEDALASALGFDDFAVDRLLVERAGVDRERPRCEVELTVLEAIGAKR